MDQESCGILQQSQSSPSIRRFLGSSYTVDTALGCQEAPSNEFPVLSHFFLRPVYVWIPELQFPGMVKGNKPPCPYYQKTSTVTRDGFSRTLRRVIMEDCIGYLLSYRYGGWRRYVTRWHISMPLAPKISHAITNGAPSSATG
ncbi:hypothetical protein DFS34DRAFT_691898, partial [Phlyctochytrium arcticum]